MTPSSPATSRAMPKCERRSGRFEVTSTSSAMSSPACSTDGTGNPAIVSFSPSSSGETPTSTYLFSQLSEMRISSPDRSSELGQEPHVVLDEQAHVVERVATHRDAFDAHAEGETRPALGVVADRAEHVRVDH